MTVVLSDRTDALLRRIVGERGYPSADDAIRAALERLDETPAAAADRGDALDGLAVEKIEVSAAAMSLIADSLDDPKPPNAALLRAATRYRELTAADE